MAERRMISAKVLKSDEYGDLSFEAQALYPQLMLEADDFGFVTGTKRIMRSIGVQPTAIDELTNAGFLIRFENPYLVRHWFVSNFGGDFNKSDKKLTTNFIDELMQIRIDQEGAYLISDFNDTPAVHHWYTGSTPSIAQTKIAKYIYRAILNHKEGENTTTTDSNYMGEEDGVVGGGFSPEILNYAEEQAKGADDPAAYKQGILKRIREEGLKTIEEVLDADKKWKAEKKPRGKSKRCVKEESTRQPFAGEIIV